jgi:hypothetical protein
MCLITIAHAIRHHISSASFFKNFAIEPFDNYYNRRLLRWTGHVARMPSNQTPRRPFLTAFSPETPPFSRAFYPIY